MSDLCVRRLKREMKALMREPIDGIDARPLEQNIRIWHYCIRGSSGTPYEGGYYHGTLEFPKDYPLRPPAIKILTPSGRFKEDRKLCFSFSDFHPEYASFHITAIACNCCLPPFFVCTEAGIRCGRYQPFFWGSTLSCLTLTQLLEV